MRRRYNDLILLFLLVLIVLSPVLWALGLPLGKVAAVTGYWIILWLLTATIGKKNEH